MLKSSDVLRVKLAKKIEEALKVERFLKYFVYEIF